MAEIPFLAGETAPLKLATPFHKRVTVHFESKVFELEPGGKRTYSEHLTWDESLVPEAAPKGETGSVVKWKAATRPPGTTGDAKPAEVKATVYGKSQAGEAVSATPQDDLLVVPGLMDARARIEPIAKAASIDLAASPRCWLVDFGDPCIRAGDPGWGRWNGPLIDNVPLTGELRFVESAVTPRLYGVYVPSGVAQSASSAIDFVVFFHPAIRADIGFPPGETHYPHHARYVRCVMDYVVDGHYGAHQTQLSKKDVVYVFPMGSTGKQLGELTRHDVLLATLEEMVRYLVRFAGFKNDPPREVGRVAIGCYSFGATHVQRLLESCLDKGAFAGTFYEKHWRETYHCDPVPEKSSRGRYAKLLADWWRQGADGRVARLYVQPNGESLGAPLVKAMGDPVPAAFHGARQYDKAHEGDRGGATYLNTGLEFWEGMFFVPGTKKHKIPLHYFDIHGWFPNLFQYHGLKNSLFRSL